MSNIFTLFSRIIGLITTGVALQYIYFDLIHHHYHNNMLNWPVFTWLTPHLISPYLILFVALLLIGGIGLILRIKIPISSVIALSGLSPLMAFTVTDISDSQLLLLASLVLIALTPQNDPNSASQKWSGTLFTGLFSIVFFWRSIAYLNWDWLSAQTLNAMIDEWSRLSPLFVMLKPYTTLIHILAFGIPLCEIMWIFLPWKYKKSIPLIWLYCVIWIQVSRIIPGAFNYMPLILMALSVFFIPEHYYEMGVNRIKTYIHAIRYQGRQKNGTSPALSSKTRGAIILFIGLQLSLPFALQLCSHIFTTVRWQYGYFQFAWAMKSETTRVSGECVVVNPNTNAIIARIPVTASKPKLHKRALTLLRYAHYLRDSYATPEVPEPAVYANIQKSINFRPLVQFTDPRINLSKETHYNVFTYTSWIVEPPPHYFDSAPDPTLVK